MANIHDYLRWRGDIAFAEHSFNDVDNLVLSAFVYLDLSGIVPTEEQGGSVLLTGACRALLAKSGGDVKPYVRSLAKVDTLFVELLAHSERFATARLSAYVDIVDTAHTLQFAAMQIDLPDAGTYIAFRGTDTSLAGWRENLMISFQITSAQQEAARYLERAIMRVQDSTDDIRVGGHSKGGNLAEYAAAVCPEHLRERITRVYSNDGPGMAPEVMPQSPRTILGDQLHIIVPHFSVIGMIFARKNEHRLIVASSGAGIEQHDITTWKVQRNDIVKARELDPNCLGINDTIVSWANETPLEDRERITNEVFDALQVAGDKTFEQIATTPDHLQQVMRALGDIDERTRNMVIALVQKAVGSSVGAVRNALVKTFSDAGRRILGGPRKAGVIRTKKGRPNLKVYIES